jgi:hypothetical protein
MGDLNYSCEKYGRAVELLAVGNGTLGERLLIAYREAHHGLDGGAGNGRPISDALLSHMRALNDRMTAVSATSAEEGTVSATIKAMTLDELKEAAQELMDVSFLLDNERTETTRGR